jgi:hypothetical protein
MKTDEQMNGLVRELQAAMADKVVDRVERGHSEGWIVIFFTDPEKWNTVTTNDWNIAMHDRVEPSAKYPGGVQRIVRIA